LWFEINPEKIGDIIGPGGKIIKKIEAGNRRQARHPAGWSRLISLRSMRPVAKKAKKIVEDLTREVGIGEVFTGKVTRIADFGAFVEILPGKDGLVHISQLSRERVNRTEDVLQRRR